MNRFVLRVKLALLVIAVAPLLASCHIDFDIPPDAPLHLSVYRDNKLVGARSVAAEEQAKQITERWLATHRDGWRYGFRTRPPQVVLAGKDFSIDVLDDEVTVKYCRGFLQCHLWTRKDHELHQALSSIAG